MPGKGRGEEGGVEGLNDSSLQLPGSLNGGSRSLLSTSLGDGEFGGVSRKGTGWSLKQVDS